MPKNYCFICLPAWDTVFLPPLRPIFLRVLFILPSLIPTLLYSHVVLYFIFKKENWTTGVFFFFLNLPGPHSVRLAELLLSCMKICSSSPFSFFPLISPFQLLILKLYSECLLSPDFFPFHSCTSSTPLPP